MLLLFTWTVCLLIITINTSIVVVAVICATSIVLADAVCATSVHLDCVSTLLLLY